MVKSSTLVNTEKAMDLENTTHMIEDFNQKKYASETKMTDNMDYTQIDGEKSKWLQDKKKEVFRQYTMENERVRNFYYLQHEKQTYKFNVTARKTFKPGNHARMGMWEALELLNTLVDESDPDTQFTQIDHALQSAEAVRRDGGPRWLQLTALIHDAGKLLYFFGAPGQWAVVGDTFPVGCKFDEAIVYGSKSFEKNPDYYDERYNTEYGVYKPGIGLDNVMLSFGHDEYLYEVMKPHLDERCLAVIRYHSFYPWHREGAYQWMENEKDKELKKYVLQFNPYDLYSKSDALPDLEATKKYYKELIDEFLPKEIEW